MGGANAILGKGAVKLFDAGADRPRERGQKQYGVTQLPPVRSLFFSMLN